MYAVFDYYCMAFEAISTLLYIFLISKMLYSGIPLFRSGFFMIFIACSFSDIASCFIHAAMRHIVSNMEESLKMGAKAYSIIYRILYYLSTQALTSHVLLSLLLSANRCTAVGWSSRHSELWSTRNTLIAIAFVYMVPLVFYAEILWSADAAVVMNGTTIFIDLKAELLSSLHISGIVIFAVRSALCLIMSIYTLRKLLEIAAVGSLSSVSVVERKLCMHAIILFAGSWIMLAQQAIWVYAASTNDMALGLWIANQFAWINDVVVYTNLYSIILCSSQVRSLFGFFGRCTVKPSAEASMSDTPQPQDK